MKSEDLVIHRCQPGEEQRIIDLAEVVWIPTFEPMLPPDRLRYLFNFMYAPQKIRQQLSDPDHMFFILRQNQRDIGYSHLIFSDEWVKLEKIYLLPAMQGMGSGLYLLRSMISEAIEKERSQVRLQVNRANDKAIRFYQRFGFEIIASEDFDVGGGHVMDDYVMVLDVNNINA